ncbi:hypothetical protein HRbin09_02124 [bacterium HR09]|nr:hypothetical protein HRbin09_02124 [bacterium HR09]
MDARFLHVLQNPGNGHAFPIGHQIHIQLQGPLQKTVQKHRVFRLGPQLPFPHASQLGSRVHHLHAPAAQHVGRSQQNRVAEPGGGPFGFRQADHRFTFRLMQAKLSDHRGKPLSIFSEVNRFRRGTQDPHPVLHKRPGKLERGLTPKLHQNTVGLFLLNHFQNVFQSQRLKVQAVGGVPVGGYGFRVAVHHYRGKAFLPQTGHGMDAAGIELNALADAHRTGAQYHYPRARVFLPLVAATEAAVVVRGGGGKLRSAGVHLAVASAQTLSSPQLPHLHFRNARHPGNSAVRKTQPLGLRQRLGIGGSPGKQGLFSLHQRGNFPHKKRVPAAGLDYLFHAHAATEGLRHRPEAVRLGDADASQKGFAIQSRNGRWRRQIVPAPLQGPHRL